MNKKSSLVYEFGPYCLSLAECQLTRAGNVVALRRRLFDLLTALVRHAGQVRTKDELLTEVWGSDHHVEESNLTVSLNTLRRTLGDEVRIETVAGRGYRFATEVRVIANAPPRAAAPTVASDATPEPPGGALPLHTRYYLARATDEEFHTAVARHDSVVLVKGARQVGKTSLLARGLQRAREAGAVVVLTDFQHFTADAFASADQLLLTLAELIADQLELDVLPQQTWKSFISPSTNFERYLRREALGKIAAPVVWGLDEVDRLFGYPYASEIFGLFRSWHNLRALDPAGPWPRFTIALAYATEAHLFISDLNQSPFNIGTRLALEDFTCAEVAELNQRYGAPLDEAGLARFFELMGGHPYLVQCGLYEMTVHGRALAAIEAQAESREGIFGDHLRRMLLSLKRDTELCEAVRRLLRGETVLANADFYRLRSAGVLTGETTAARLRCQLYARFLRKHLL